MVVFKWLLLLSIFSTGLISPAFAQQSNRPFQDEGGCTSGSTSATGGRKSCSGSFAWPDTAAERPNVKYTIDIKSVSVQSLDNRGSGSGCGNPIFEYTGFKTLVPGIGETTVQLPTKVTVTYNARGGSGAGTRGRIECRVVGRYNSL